MYYLFLAEGFEVTEALATLDVMRRAKLSVQTVGVTGEYVTSSHGVTVKTDVSLSDVSTEDMEGVILPGGMPGTLNLERSEKVLECVKYSYENGLITPLSSAISAFSAAERRPASRALKMSSRARITPPPMLRPTSM